jgi:tetratricopeptide (TPR) repeat protein
MTLVCAAALTAAAVAQPPAGAKPASTPQEEKARELFAAGKPDDALKQLQEAVKANPKLPPARVQLAGMFYLAKQGRAARQNLETALAEDPRHPEALLLNAQFALAEGHATDAIFSCQAAVALAADPRWDPAQRKQFVREGRIGLAAAFEARRDFAGARDQYAALLADDPKSGLARSRLAATVFHLGKPDEAFAELQTAFKDDPGVELPELQLSGLYAQRGDLDKAEETLKQGVAAHPTLAKAHRAYAAWLTDVGKLGEAQAALDAAAKIDPASKDTVAVRGMLLRNRKDYAAAETVFAGLLRDAPESTFAALNLALVQAESGDPAKVVKGIKLAEAEARKNPRNPEALAVLAWCYFKSDQTEEAEKLIAAAAQAGPLNRDTGYFAARILADGNRTREAYKVLQDLATARGAHVYRAESAALLAEVAAKLTPKPPEKK